MTPGARRWIAALGGGVAGVGLGLLLLALGGVGDGGPSPKPAAPASPSAAGGVRALVRRSLADLAGTADAEADLAVAVAVVAQREVSPGLWRPVEADALAPGDRVAVRVRAERPTWVYVFLDGPDGLTRPWPQPAWSRRGPVRLGAGETLLLPAEDGWYRLGPESVDLAVVARRRPDLRLDAEDPVGWRAGLAALPAASVDPAGPWLSARLRDGRVVPVRAALARGTGALRLVQRLGAP